MITAVDSSVLFAVFNAEPAAERWLDLLRKRRAAGKLVVCDIVVAEVAAYFDDTPEFQAHAETMGIRFDPISFETALVASRIFKAYHDAGGKRDRLIPDFLIGAHALMQADCLASGDTGFAREHFRRLRIISP